MNFFTIRKARKGLKELLHHAKHVRHMYEDIADPTLLEKLATEEKAVLAASKSRDIEVMGRVGDDLEKICLQVAPPRKHPKTRENIEVLFVAIGAAMAIRAYFFQPFKIPTGSMQPTLYGITVRQKPAIPGNNPISRIANLIFCGERHVTIRAKSSGSLRLNNYGTQMDLQTTKSQSKAIFFINNVPHKIPMNLWHDQKKAFRSLVMKNKEYFTEGEVLFDGIIKSGDYILVNRLKYNFIRPKRGDITVFDTRDLDHPQVRNNAYYIKRMVGLPGETISLAPKYLLVNGEKPADPRFNKVFNNDDYSGYVFGNTSLRPTDSRPLLGNPGDSIILENDEHLFFGDNTTMSLDGRYFGGVKRKRILGPAFFVCWPLDRAGFAEISH